MEINRDRQNEILEILHKFYPEPTREVVRPQEELLDCATILLLEEHGLVKAGLTRKLDGEYMWVAQGTVITAKGIDFLADDGGTSAKINTITVKIHTDSIKAILEAKLDQSDLPVEKKNWLRNQVNTMSDESLKIVTKSLVQKGLDHIPDLYKWLQGLVP